jgi:hypothetical protein
MRSIPLCLGDPSTYQESASHAESRTEKEPEHLRVPSIRMLRQKAKLALTVVQLQVWQRDAAPGCATQPLPAVHCASGK